MFGQFDVELGNEMSCHFLFLSSLAIRLAERQLLCVQERLGDLSA